jgi:hypothetical protein
MEWETPLFTYDGELDVTENLKIRTEGRGGKIREIIVDGEVVGRFRSSGNDCVWFDRPKPKPEPEQMAFFECDYSWNSIGWQKLRCGPMTMAEAKALSKQIEIAKAFYRNSRIVPAAPPQELWGVHSNCRPGPVFVCDSRELAEDMAEFLDDSRHVRVWDGGVQPRYGYVYATRQGTP